MIRLIAAPYVLFIRNRYRHRSIVPRMSLGKDAVLGRINGSPNLEGPDIIVGEMFMLRLVVVYFNPGTDRSLAQILR